MPALAEVGDTTVAAAEAEVRMEAVVGLAEAAEVAEVAARYSI